MENHPAASASVAARNFLDDAATPPCGRARRGITLDSNLFTAPQTAPTVKNLYAYLAVHAEGGIRCFLLLLAIHPSIADVIFVERLGALAVDAGMSGYSHCIISQWLTEFVLVPLNLLVPGRKRVPPKVFFGVLCWQVPVSQTSTTT